MREMDLLWRYSVKNIVFVCLLVFSSGLLAQDAIPAGTILPVELNSSIRSDKAKPGQVFSARVMQEVPLPRGRKIHSGAKVLGYVVAVRPANDRAGAEITLRFETLEVGGRRIPVTASLRALASMMEVFEAQVPESGPDRGTSEYSWTTDQIGGGEVDYGGGGAVTHGSYVVGRSVPGGVLARVTSRPGTRCRGETDDNDRPQALWLFSSDACGVYGFRDMSLIHAGRSDPVGEISLQSRTGKLNIRGGSGMLLRVTDVQDVPK
jgi:hypothetical protein